MLKLTIGFVTLGLCCAGCWRPPSSGWIEDPPSAAVATAVATPTFPPMTPSIPPDLALTATALSDTSATAQAQPTGVSFTPPPPDTKTQRDAPSVQDLMNLNCEQLLTVTNDVNRDPNIRWHVGHTLDVLTHGTIRGMPVDISELERKELVAMLENLMDADGMFCGLVEADPEEWR